MSLKTQHHQRTPSRRSLLSLLNPASYVPQREGAGKHGDVASGKMGERAGNQPQNNMNDDVEAKENATTHMNRILPSGTQHTEEVPAVPLPHNNSTGSKGSTSTASTAISRPQLPPRPDTSDSSKSTIPSTPPLHRPSLTDRKPTTQVSTLDVQTLTFPDGSRGTFDSDVNTSSPSKGTSTLDYISRKCSRITHTEDISEDKASITSLTPSSIHTRRIPAGITSPGSIFSGFGLGSADLTPAQRLLALQSFPALPPFLDSIPDYLRTFGSELDNLPEIQHNLASDESNEEVVLAQFRSKQKQYFILSSSGKPIWSRHGDLNLINGYIGVISTIISTFASFSPPCPLRTFKAGSTLFVITNPGRGPLYFVGISRIDGEGVSQIEKQLDSLYQQILSTLTLPRLKQLFTHRPGTDLSRSLEGTEKLLSGLCDTFTSGSPSSLLSALECLRMRKTHRALISSTLLSHKTEKLLYGLVVAGGKLVSVLRPKRHSLHPGDLELIFNMLFSNGKKSGGEGENWVPVCLPGFEDGGYLYLYVSFLPLAEAKEHKRGGSNASTPRRSTKKSSLDCGVSTGGTDSPLRSSFIDEPSTPRLAPRIIALSDEVQDDEVAILLISPDREAFFEMKEMRDALAKSLSRNGSLDHIARAVKLGRPSILQLLLPRITARDRRLGEDQIQMRHFLYKSRADVQFVQSRVEWGQADDDVEVDHFELRCRELIKHRRLMSIYAALHTSLHSRHTHPRTIYSVNREYIALAWITPKFEFYAVAGRSQHTDVSSDGDGSRGEKMKLVERELEKQKAQLAKEAERVVEWVERERERVFILGGAVF